jgi:hypothetical protein
MLTNGTSGETTDIGDKNVLVKSFDENGMPFSVRGDVEEVFESESFPETNEEVAFLSMTKGVDDNDMLATFSGVFVL